MDRVNIITITTCSGPGKQKATGMFLIEQIHDGIPITKHDFLHRDSITAKELSLQLLANAMYIVNHANVDFDSIEVYSDEPYIVSAFEKKWVEKWNKDNWLNARGKDLANADTWKLICKLMNQSGKRFIFTNARSSYDGWMRTQINIERKKRHDKVRDN